MTIDATTPRFEFRRAASVGEAVQWLATPGARVHAGGTDLVPNLRRGLERPSIVVDIGGIAGLAGIAWRDDACAIGATVTLARLAADARVASTYPALAEAAAAVGAPAHRSAGTVGGNLCADTRCVHYNQGAWWRGAVGGCLKRGGDVCHVAPQGRRCHAAFCGDLAPALIALSAELDVASHGGVRRMAAVDLYRDDGAAHLALLPGELVTAVRLPPPDGVSGYRKARVRGSIDFPLAGVAIALRVGQRSIERAIVAVTGVGPRPVVVGTEAIVGRRVDDETAALLATRVEQSVKPMRTTATPAAYRRQVAGVLAARLLRTLAA